MMNDLKPIAKKIQNKINELYPHSRQTHTIKINLEMDNCFDSCVGGEGNLILVYVPEEFLMDFENEIADFVSDISGFLVYDIYERKQ